MDRRFFLKESALAGFGMTFLHTSASAEEETSEKAIIVHAPDATYAEHLAAEEIRRYVYQRTGELLKVEARRDVPDSGRAILVGSKNRGWIGEALDSRFDESRHENLGDESYLLVTTDEGDRRLLAVVGGSPIGTLYGGYRFAEHLGVRFFIHGDVIPDRRTAFHIPDIDEVREPLFEQRGILPFHDFPEGPDWWSVDDYKSVLAQLPKLGMNFIGMHCYPEGNVGPEPLVWIGREEDANADGSVQHSYPSSHFNTVEGEWGYTPTWTSEYDFGLGQLFPEDEFGADYHRGLTPRTFTESGQNELFDRCAGVLNEAFRFANAHGIDTCLGTEIPLTVPEDVKDRLARAGKDPTDPETLRELYRGIFQRIEDAHPLDYYWFWTPEGWTWEGTDPEDIEKTKADFEAAIDAAEAVDASFTLATCGWVLGPAEDRAMFDEFLPERMPMSTIHRHLGFTPVDPGFARVEDRPKWTIPWLEDDPAMIIPQLWVGRMRRDAADAHAYECTGLMGIHWRTREIGPTVAALAEAGWNQEPWNPDFGQRVDGDEASLEPYREGERERDLPARSFYQDWVRTQFGEEAAEELIDIFTRMDGGPLAEEELNANLPRPAEWVDGPGGIQPDERPWETVREEYEFVAEMESLRPRIRGTGNLERFDYWLNQFRYLRGIGKLNCTWGRLEEALSRAEEAGSKQEARRIARDEALPIRREMIVDLRELLDYLIPTITTYGALGNLTNWQQHIRKYILDWPEEQISRYLGEELPEDAQPDKVYRGDPHAFVPTKRTSLQEGEALELEVVVLSQGEPQHVTLHWARLGSDDFNRLPFEHVARGVYRASLPSSASRRPGLEYYVEVEVDGQMIRKPATAPSLNQSVVVAPGGSLRS